MQAAKSVGRPVPASPAPVTKSDEDRAVGSPTRQRPIHYPFWFGGSASSMAACVTHPLDLVKVRLQTRTGDMPKSMSGTFVHIVKHNGVRGLYNGLSASLLRQLTYSTTRFGIYEELKSRPPSEYASWEEPPQEGEPFDYDAVPNRFYFNVESAGSLPPDTIVSEGIKVLQQKLAGLIHELAEGEGDGMNGDYNGPRSPEYGTGADGFGGYTTPFGNGGNQSSWGGAGGTTPYGTTPYGAGQSNWS